MPSVLIGRADLMRREVNNSEIGANSTFATSRRFIDGAGTRRSLSAEKISHSAQSSLASHAESRAVNFARACPDREIDAISRIATGCVHYHLRVPLTPFDPR